jgi:hypothetical protein
VGQYYVVLLDIKFLSSYQIEKCDIIQQFSRIYYEYSILCPLYPQMYTTVVMQISTDGQYNMHNAISCNLSDVLDTFFWEEMKVHEAVDTLSVGYTVSV